MKSALILMGLLFSTGYDLSAQSHASPSFEWLEGNWAMSRPNGSIRLETWGPLESHMMAGKGLKVSGRDTILLEHIVIEWKDDHYWYIPTLPDQNDGKAVPFKLVQSDPVRLVFENAEHDFPQRILYTWLPGATSGVDDMTDRLRVRVESLDGEGLEFDFKRQ